MKQRSRFRTVLQDQLSDYVTAIAWASDNCFYAISAAGDLVQWQHKDTGWKRTDLRTDMSKGQPSALNALGISANGHFLAVAGQAGTLMIWDLTQNPPQITMSQTFPSTWLDQLAWNPSDSILATGVGKNVYLWKGSQREPIRILEFQSSTVLNLSWHPHGQLLAVGGHHGVKIWDIHSQTSPESLEVPGASLCTAWSPEGQFLASGNLDRTLSVTDHGHPPPWLMQGFPSKVSCIAWKQSPSKQEILAAAASDGISIWTQQESLSWQSTVLTGHKGFVRNIAFQPNGKLLASAGDESTLRLWNTDSTFKQSLAGPPEGTHCLAWNQSGNQLAVGGTDGTILIFESDHAGKGFGQASLTFY